MSETYMDPNTAAMHAPPPKLCCSRGAGRGQRNWYRIAEQPAPAPRLAHPEGCAALRSVLVAVPRVSRFCKRFPDEFELHLLRQRSCAHALLCRRVIPFD